MHFLSKEFNWSHDWSLEWLVGCFAGWLVASLVGWFNASVVGRFTRLGSRALVKSMQNFENDNRSIEDAAVAAKNQNFGRSIDPILP